jgi:hypothetical protein
MIIDELFEGPQLCPECGGISFSDLILAEKKDACYYKVKASAKVWPSAYASGRLVQCRKKGAANYGNKSEGVAEGLEDPYDQGFSDGYNGNRKRNPFPLRSKEAEEYDEGWFEGLGEYEKMNQVDPQLGRCQALRSDEKALLSHPSGRMLCVELGR